MYENIVLQQEKYTTKKIVRSRMAVVYLFFLSLLCFRELTIKRL
jgi:hypothetical protein